jgi:hypothetical protein
MRVKLCEKYQTEREDICNRLIEIVDLDDNNSFLLSELDEDTDKQNAILAMKDEIKKYFASSEISALKPNMDMKRPYLNIVRGIFKKQGYEIFSKDFGSKEAKTRTIRYIIFRKN